MWYEQNLFSINCHNDENIMWVKKEAFFNGLALVCQALNIDPYPVEGSNSCDQLRALVMGYYQWLSTGPGG